MTVLQQLLATFIHDQSDKINFTDRLGLQSNTDCHVIYGSLCMHGNNEYDDLM